MFDKRGYVKDGVAKHHRHPRAHVIGVRHRHRRLCVVQRRNLQLHPDGQLHPRAQRPKALVLQLKRPQPLPLPRQPVPNARLPLLALPRIRPNVIARRTAVAHSAAWPPAPLLVRQACDPHLLKNQLFPKLKLVNRAWRRALLVQQVTVAQKVYPRQRLLQPKLVIGKKADHKRPVLRTLKKVVKKRPLNPVLRLHRN